jgi:hypothetical protein
MVIEIYKCVQDHVDLEGADLPTSQLIGNT